MNRTPATSSADRFNSRIAKRDTFAHLLDHGSAFALELERAACLASTDPAIRARVPLIDARLAQV